MTINKSSDNQSTTDIDLTLARATVYSALALGFRPPTEAAIARLVAPENAAALADAAALLDADEKSRLVDLVHGLSHASELTVGALLCKYRTLFGHTVRGRIPPYETEYGNEALFQQPQEMGDLMGFYRAFGLTVKFGAHERCDHVSCECEFLSFLALKEAYALEHQDQEMLAEVRKAARLFLKDHLGRFLPAFANKLSREDRSGFYGALSKLCLKFVDLEGHRFKVPLGAVDLALRPADDDRVPMACASGAECAAMPGACAPEGAEPI